MIERTSTTLEKVMAQQSIKLKDEHRDNHIMVIAKNDMLSVDGVDLIKQIRETNKLTVLNSNKLTYSDYRGEEYLLPLFLVMEAALPVVVERISSWITNKMTSYSAHATDDQMMPKISVSVLRTEKFEMTTIIAEDAEDVLKILNGLRDQDDAK